MLEIFIFSFLVALTGALSPGPLLTFTIYKSLKQKRGYLAAIYILLGHATIEFALIIALLAGASLIFQNIIFLTLIGFIGGIFLVIYGIFAIRGVLKTDFDTEFILEENLVKGYKGNSYVGGILVSLSNPFWTFWWAVIGLSLMVSFDITLLMPIEIHRDTIILYRTRVRRYRLVFSYFYIRLFRWKILESKNIQICFDRMWCFYDYFWHLSRF